MGLMPNDLEDLVSHIISIDEFESKLDNEKAIVVGFKVDDKEPAQDLSRFIEKSAIDLLDTEVSPAPDTDGKYIVFVEYSRDKQFPENLITTLESMENLTRIKKEDYRFTAYKKKGEHEIDADIIRRKVRLKPSPIEKLERDTTAAFESYFSPYVTIDSVKYNLKLMENHVKGLEKLLKIQRGLNKKPKEVKENLSFTITNETVVEFNKLRLAKINTEIQKEIVELWSEKERIFRNFANTIDSSLSNIMGLFTKIFDTLNKAKRDLQIVPGSESDIEVIESFKNDAIAVLKQFLSFHAKEYISIQLRAKFASLMSEIGVYNEVFEDIHNFFYESAVDNISLNDGNIIFEKHNQPSKFKFIDMSPANKLFEKYRLDGMPFAINEEAKAYSRDMYRILGAGYQVNLIKGYLLISKAGTDTAILLRDNQ